MPQSGIYVNSIAHKVELGKILIKNTVDIKVSFEFLLYLSTTNNAFKFVNWSSMIDEFFFKLQEVCMNGIKICYQVIEIVGVGDCKN